VVIDMQAREWCKLPYHDHPKGCPNFGRRAICPPQSSLVTDFFDLEKNTWLMVVAYDLGAHMDRLHKLYPDWSDLQLRNPLYWQGSVHSYLKTLCLDFVQKHPNSIYTVIPEAMGVHVFDTVLRFGIPIEKRPKRIIYKVALLGYPQGKSS
jgi:hypothetical protein